jgi:hypothetical protein
VNKICISSFSTRQFKLQVQHLYFLAYFQNLTIVNFEWCLDSNILCVSNSIQQYFIKYASKRYIFFLNHIVKWIEIIRSDFRYCLDLIVAILGNIRQWFIISSFTGCYTIHLHCINNYTMLGVRLAQHFLSKQRSDSS